MGSKILLHLIIFPLLIYSQSVCAQTESDSLLVVNTDSIKYVFQQAEAGDSAYQYILGGWYYTGTDSILQDYEKAVYWWDESAKRKNIYAIERLGYCYQLGHGVAADSAYAVKLFESAALRGNENVVLCHDKMAREDRSIFSALLLKDIYLRGIGTKRNDVKSNEYLKMAAEYGHSESILNYGISLYNNDKYDESVVWLKQSADQGNSVGQFVYGLQLFEGKGIIQDKTLGISYLQKSADQNHVSAAYHLGRIYLYGDGIEPDASKAVPLLRISAVEDRRAAWLLGLCYKNGKGVGQDYYLSTQWLSWSLDDSRECRERVEKLLQDDNNGPFTQYLRGLYRYYIDENIEEAMKYFKMVAKSKVYEGFTMTAVCMADNRNPKRNEKKAFRLFEKVASNSAVANYYLSQMCATGTGTEKNDSLAVDYLAKAANQDIAYAQCSLGDRYMIGDGVVRDYTKAATLYLKAERQHHLTSSSAINLARCYEMKIGVLPDLNMAEERITSLKSHKEIIKLNILLAKVSFK